MSGRRVHLISPVFHGYWRAIAESLRAAGHEVTTHTYDHNATVRHRLWHKVRHEMPRRLGVGRQRELGRAWTAEAITAVREARPDVVVVVKGDRFTGDFWDFLEEQGLPRVLWLYDELRRTAYTAEVLARVGPIASYSPLDVAGLTARGIPCTHLPLAFDHRLLAVDDSLRTDEVTFVGARYPSRERVLTTLAGREVPVRVFGRWWSHHPVDRLRTWDLTRPGLPSGRDLSRAEAYRVMAASAATINLHGDQDGFTMRTFEANGVGGLQLIDRTDVGDLYEPGAEILPFSSIDELTELSRRARVDRPWSDRIRTRARQRTLAEHTFDHRVAVLESLWA